MTDYITSASLKATLNANNYSGADADIAEAITTASRAVDKACDRVFYLRDVSNDEVRTYSPRMPTVCFVDDLAAAPTTVLSDQDGDGVFELTWTLHTDYELMPENAVADGRPYTYLKIKPSSGHTFPHWNPHSVQVTGRFGWTTTPSEVLSLTRLLAVQILMRPRNAPFGVIGVQEAVRIAQQDPAMAGLIRDLRRDPLFV